MRPRVLALNTCSAIANLESRLGASPHGPARRARSASLRPRFRCHPERREGSALPCLVSGTPVQFSRQLLFTHARQAAPHSLLCSSSGARIPSGNRDKPRVLHAASEACGVNSGLPGFPAQFGPCNSYIGSKHMCTWFSSCGVRWLLTRGVRGVSTAVNRFRLRRIA
jgi:hypothetical protein